MRVVVVRGRSRTNEVKKINERDAEAGEQQYVYEAGFPDQQ